MRPQHRARLAVQPCLGRKRTRSGRPHFVRLATRLEAPTSLADLGFELEAIDAVARTVAGAPVSNPEPSPRKMFVPGAAGVSGKRPLPERN